MILLLLLRIKGIVELLLACQLDPVPSMVVGRWVDPATDKVLTCLLEFQGEDLDFAYGSISAFASRRTNQEAILGAEESIKEIKYVFLHRATFIFIFQATSFCVLFTTCLCICSICSVQVHLNLHISCGVVPGYREATLSYRAEAVGLQKQLQRLQSQLESLGGQSSSLIQGRRARAAATAGAAGNLLMVEERLASRNLEVFYSHHLYIMGYLRYLFKQCHRPCSMFKLPSGWSWIYWNFCWSL